MGKMQALPLATTAQKGIASIGAGLAVPSSGTVNAVRSYGQLWVDPSGNDTTGDGSMSNPYLTLAKAFAIIAAAPLADGYTVFLPPGDWYEAVSLPPAGTKLLGCGVERTRVAGVAGAALVWLEAASSTGARYFEDLTLTAGITGRDSGDLTIKAERASIIGTLTLVGHVEMTSCSGAAFSFVNCSNVEVRTPRTTSSSTFSLTYDATGGTNGSGAVSNEIFGGTWGAVSYDSEDASVKLYVTSARVASLTSHHDGVIVARGTSSGVLTATDALSVIEYDGPVVNSVPTFAGAGTFLNAELVITKAVASNFGSGETTVTIPPQSVATLKNVFVMSTLAGVAVSWVSNTANSITLAIVGPPTHSAYELRILVKP